MTITVIAQITRDTLIFPDQDWRVLNGLGGAMYTVSALATLTNRPIRLVCNVGSDIYGDVIDAFSRFDKVDTSGLTRVDGPHYHCYILFASEYGTQYDKYPDVKIMYSQIRPFIHGSDFVLVSPMTGFDLDLSTLRQIRQSAECPVYFDYHILALDKDSLGNRFLRRRKNWFGWCTSCDHLQLNLFEAQTLCDFPIKTDADLELFSAPILNKGVKSVAITMGERGTFVSWMEQRKEVQFRKIEAYSQPNVVDATGCGDVFAAGFIAGMLSGTSIIGSYELANHVAGLKAGVSGFDSLARILPSRISH